MCAPTEDIFNRGKRLSVKSGAQSRNRTSDTRIFNPLLYQLSYLGTCRAAQGRPDA